MLTRIVTQDVEPTDLDVSLAPRLDLLIAAERRGETIAVEIKSFLRDSEVADLEDALGQFVLYRSALRRQDPSRRLLLAVPQEAFESVWSDDVIEDEKVALLVFDPNAEVIERWVP